jgi:hypothetical protein
MRPLILLLPPLLALTGCARPSGTFSEENARRHVDMLAGTIGSRPVGTAANARARAYILNELRQYGFDVRVQETDARRPEVARTARVSNIIAVRRGARDEAVGLLSHYDSAPEAPGAGDDAFGVAVSLEAARQLSERTDRHWSLMVLITDGEEAGLMGAAALVTDREVAARVKAYLNIEAVGSSGTALLFETGPGNPWLVRPWAAAAPHPRGNSFGVEIYKRLPNDTDFSILKRHDIPGLNFAITGDSYAYHTARDTADRLSGASLRETGANVVAVVSALDAVDITQRSTGEPTYFDLGETAAVTYGPAWDWGLAAVALITGVIAWVRVSSAAIGLGGLGRWLLTLVWTAIGAAVVVASMLAAIWALRAAREVYHPWYAQPERLFVMLMAIGVTAGWGIVRLGRFLPARAHGLRHPLVTWSAALPVWLLLASGSLWNAPGAAYLWTVPLLAAGLLLAISPPRSSLAVRLASLAILAVSTTIWLTDTRDFLRFLVAVFGRLPMVTPIFVYPAILTIAGIMLLPPFVAVAAIRRPLLRPSLMTAVVLFMVAAAFGWAYTAQAYTFEQPLRRHVRAIQIPPAATGPSASSGPGRSASSGRALWEVASIEPGLDLADAAPGGWMPVRDPLPAGVPWGPLPHPFVFRTEGPSLGEAPLTITGYRVRPLPGGIELELTVTPRDLGTEATFLLPPSVTPARANLAGLVRRGRWSATYVAVPPEGVTFRASFADVPPEVLGRIEVLVTADRFPEGTGWQGLPSWLPQERTVWSGTAAWLLTLPAWAGIAPVPPLR